MHADRPETPVTSGDTEAKGIEPDLEVSFFDVVFRQRAVREFSDHPVTDAMLERCLRAATHAPSAENLQPWVFVVVRDHELRSGIGELTRLAWQEGGRQHSQGRLSEQLLAEVDRGAEGGLSSAPVLVVVCGDGEIAIESTLPSSIYPAAQNLLLAASALGLGSAMTTLATRFADELRSLLNLPSTVRPLAVIPLGWPKRPPGPPRRLPLRDRVHRDRYGSPW